MGELSISWGMLIAAALILGISIFCHKQKMIGNKIFSSAFIFTILLIGGGLAGVKGFAFGGNRVEIIEELKKEVKDLNLLTRELMAKEAVNNGRIASGDGLNEAKKLLKPIYGEKTDEIIKLYVKKGIYKASSKELTEAIDVNARTAEEKDSFLLNKIESFSKQPAIEMKANYNE